MAGWQNPTFKVRPCVVCSTAFRPLSGKGRYCSDACRTSAKRVQSHACAVRTRAADNGVRYIWYAMLDRCLNPEHRSFEDYGGRGVSVCTRWQMSYEDFAVDVGVRPAGTSLDRIDPNGHYEPENCRWADAETQANNRTDTHWLEVDGIKLSLSQWARRLGIRPTTLSTRLARGWAVEQAVTTPPLKRGSRRKEISSYAQAA